MDDPMTKHDFLHARTRNYSRDEIDDDFGDGRDTRVIHNYCYYYYNNNMYKR